LLFVENIKSKKGKKERIKMARCKHRGGREQTEE